MTHAFKNFWKSITQAIVGDDETDEWSIWIRVRPDEPAYAEVVPPSGKSFVAESPAIKEAVEKVRAVYENHRGLNDDMDVWPPLA